MELVVLGREKAGRVTTVRVHDQMPAVGVVGLGAPLAVRAAVPRGVLCKLTTKERRKLYYKLIISCN